MSGHNCLEWCRLSICSVNKWWKERCNRKAWHREAEQEMWNASCQRDWRSLSPWLTQVNQCRQLALLLQDTTDLPNPCSYGDEIYKNIYIKKHLEGQAWIQQPTTRDSAATVIPRRSWRWRQWFEMMTSRKMDVEGLYESAQIRRKRRQCYELVLEHPIIGEPGVCTGRQGLESWKSRCCLSTVNCAQVIVSSCSTSVEVIILFWVDECLQQLRHWRHSLSVVPACTFAL